LAFGRRGCSLLAAIESRCFFVAADPRPLENRTFSIQSAIFFRLILSTHATQAALRAEDDYLHA
jgi:hypothetical protein